MSQCSGRWRLVDRGVVRWLCGGGESRDEREGRAEFMTREHMMLRREKGGVKKHRVCLVGTRWCWYLTAEAVQGAALALERVDDIHGGDGLAASVLGVGHGIADDVLKEDLKDTTGLL
eukprot:scaffold119363_cov57-Phaeocystis_antarctica.AAC.2